MTAPTFKSIILFPILILTIANAFTIDFELETSIINVYLPTPVPTPAPTLSNSSQIAGLAFTQHLEEGEKGKFEFGVNTASAAQYLSPYPCTTAPITAASTASPTQLPNTNSTIANAYAPYFDKGNAGFVCVDGEPFDPGGEFATATGTLREILLLCYVTTTHSFNFCFICFCCCSFFFYFFSCTTRSSRFRRTSIRSTRTSS